MAKFLTDYTYEELLADCMESYSQTRFPGGAAPLTDVGNLRLLELWHGPTCAFKDMALQVMPRLLSRALTKTNEERTAFILVEPSSIPSEHSPFSIRDFKISSIFFRSLKNVL